MKHLKGMLACLALVFACQTLRAYDMLDLAGDAVWDGASPLPMLVDVAHNGRHAGTAIVASHPYTGDLYIGLDALAGALMIERDRLTLLTPMGNVEVAEHLIREMDGRDMAPARALSELLASDITLDRRELLLRIETPWRRLPPDAEVVRPEASLDPDRRAARISLSRMRTELWHRRLDGRDMKHSRTDFEGRLLSGLWRARVRDWLEGDAYLEHYQWLYPGENHRLLLGHQRVSANPVLGTVEITGGQYAWTNRPRAVFTPYLRANTLTGLPSGALRGFDGEGPPGGRAELRVDGHIVATEIVALDGRWEFRDVELPGESVSLVEVWLFERGGNGAPVAIENLSSYHTRRLNPAGTVVVQGAAGRTGNWVEDGAGAAAGYLRAGYALSDHVNVDLLGQRDEHGEYAGAAIGVMAGPLGFAGFNAARGEGLNAWRAEIENRTRRIFWRGYRRDEPAGWRGREEEMDDRYGEIGARIGRDLTLSLVGRHLDIGARRTRYLLPALAWRLNGSVYLRARPDGEGRYLANANWRLNDRHSTSASYHRSESAARWDFRPTGNHGQRDLVSLSYVDRRNIGRRAALVWQRYSWETRRPGWAVGAMAGNGEAGFLLRADYEIFDGVRLRGELLRDPLGPFRPNGKPDTVLTLSLTADLLLTRRGLIRGRGQRALSNRGTLAGKLKADAYDAPEDQGILVDGRLAGRTDKGGAYTLPNLRPGIYAVGLDPEGLPIDLSPPDRPALVEIAAGAVTRLDFELEASFGMEGSLHDTADLAASGVRLRFLNESNEPATTTRTDAFGRWLVAGLRPGRYIIEAERSGRWMEIARETLGGEWLFDLELVLPALEGEDL